MIPEDQIEKMREEFMNKRISFKDGKGEKWIGTCQFLGYNKYLPSWGFQITIDRTPIQHVKPETIKIYESNIRH